MDQVVAHAPESLEQQEFLVFVRNSILLERDPEPNHERRLIQPSDHVLDPSELFAFQTVRCSTADGFQRRLLEYLWRLYARGVELDGLPEGHHCHEWIRLFSCAPPRR